jgi:hypothetical protein
MLLAKKMFQKIKLGFFLVGHIHNYIDKIFNRFSIKISRGKAMIYKYLCTIIFESYTSRLEITLLPKTFDFQRFALDPPKIMVNLL